MKVTDLVISYRCDQSLVSEIYDSVKDGLENRIRSDITRYRLDEDEVRSAHNFAFMEALRKFDESKGLPFESFLSGVIKRRLIDEVRKKVNRYKHEVYDWTEDKTDGDEEDTLSLFDTVQDIAANIDTILTKKEQRKLLLFLQSQVTDEVTIKLLRNFQYYKSLQQLGKAVGLTGGNLTTEVRRRLKKVARLYDEQTYGNYKDLLVA